jgi:hypothetical protein
MTQILTCLTQRHIVQVSDRRLTDLRTGDPVDDEACKAVIFANRASFGFTGLAHLKPERRGRTDLWLVSQLEGACDDVDQAVERVRAAATERFRSLTHLGPGSKRHSFVMAGWRSSYEPFAATISNAERIDGEWEPRASLDFSITEHRLGRAPVLLRVTGQPLPRAIRTALTRSLERCVELPDPLDPLIGNSLAALRAAAGTNPRIGPGALVTVVPREAPGTRGFGMPGELVVGASEVGDSHPRAYYVSATSTTTSWYAPHYVSPEMSLTGIQIHNRALSEQEIREQYELGLRERQ